MIRLIAREPLPCSEAATGRRLADPDLLLATAEQICNGNALEGGLTDEFSYILHDLRMAGTWKRTNRGRLPLTEQIIAAHLRPGSGTDFAVMDIGASDGITTLELLKTLRKDYGDRIRAYMADINLSLLRYRMGPLIEYRSAKGEPVMVRVGRLGLRLAYERHASRGQTDPIARLYLRLPFRRSMHLDTRISLVHPLVRKEPNIVTLELDCLAESPNLHNSFLGVRASNILNMDYFTAAQLRVAIGNLHAYLQDGGCLVVSRNNDTPAGEMENGSAWRKAGRQFDHLEDFGAGSELRGIVDEWRTA